MVQKFVSLSEKNQFTFKCPVFEADTKMGSCVKLRDMVWRGQHPDVRKGCQAAMEDNICPVAAMVSLYCYDSRWDNDFHGSETPKKGRLHAAVLERVARSMPYGPTMRQFGVSDVEREKLETARFRIQQELQTAPGEITHRTAVSEAPHKRRAKAAPKVEKKMVDAARTGDLSAAINA